MTEISDCHLKTRLARIIKAKPAVKRSLTLNGHRTSVSLEPAFWEALTCLAAIYDMPLARLVAFIDTACVESEASLSSRLRLFVLDAACDGHLKIHSEQQALM